MSMVWGVGTDLLAPADYTGDGKVDLSTYRPSTGTWYVLQSDYNYTSQTWTPWGNSTSVPLVADYDGDGIADYVVFQAGVWQILKSSTGYTTSLTLSLGGSSDVPLPRHP